MLITISSRCIRKCLPDWETNDCDSSRWRANSQWILRGVRSLNSTERHKQLCRTVCGHLNLVEIAIEQRFGIRNGPNPRHLCVMEVRWASGESETPIHTANRSIKLLKSTSITLWCNLHEKWTVGNVQAWGSQPLVLQVFLIMFLTHCSLRFSQQSIANHDYELDFALNYAMFMKGAMIRLSSLWSSY